MHDSHAISKVLAVVLCIILGAAAILAQEEVSAAAPPRETTPLDEAPLTNADIVKLSELQIGGGVITAMLERSGPKNPKIELMEAARDMALGKRATVSGTPELTLRTRDGDITLIARAGDYSVTRIYFTTLTFLNIEGTAAEIRTRDPRTAVVVPLEGDPRRTGVYVAELEPDEDEEWRSLKNGKFRGFSVDMSRKPDKDWTIPYEAKQDQDGVWHPTQEKKLKPGEYGHLSWREHRRFWSRRWNLRLWGGRVMLSELHGYLHNEMRLLNHLCRPQRKSSRGLATQNRITTERVFDE